MTLNVLHKSCQLFYSHAVILWAVTSFTVHPNKYFVLSLSTSGPAGRFDSVYTFSCKFSKQRHTLCLHNEVCLYTNPYSERCACDMLPQNCEPSYICYKHNALKVIQCVIMQWNFAVHAIVVLMHHLICFILCPCNRHECTIAVWGLPSRHKKIACLVCNEMVWKYIWTIQTWPL